MRQFRIALEPFSHGILAFGDLLVSECVGGWRWVEPVVTGKDLEKVSRRQPKIYGERFWKNITEIQKKKCCKYIYHCLWEGLLSGFDCNHMLRV